ncbi:LlaJI family restriction endonuclease [Lelliottia amnigena]|uniref:LlaJI family restriction endonuclease n=1 Tax=Lelliottia amnigena TaxID=61646 RepID=A0AAP2AC27_LELAM|nr:LlaJI family restriction endonuclease [Lelliottia amnigena]MBL5898860.1 LlaJI family restriction endonuclease [Lelliottia amnigena]MBL5934399.1 LlaJI family restriction endonuclease [Lelliottia amnigena]TCD11340.1 LlaJI family restriction endonuclease [Lelliottia amnigena]
MEIKLHEDKCAINTLPSQIRQVFEAEGLIQNNHERLDFCGLVMHNGTPNIFLPRNSAIPKDCNPRKIGSFLIRAIHKYVQNRYRSNIMDGTSDRLLGDSFLSLAFSLLTDYITYGIYIKRTSDIKKNQGKTCWKRTINKTHSYPSNSAPIYLDTIGCKKILSLDTEVTRIHAKVIRDLENIIGWAYFDEEPGIKQDLGDISLPNLNVKDQLQSLERELNNLYGDREITLIKNLCIYLSLGESNSSNSIVIGINKFHSMWEKMIDSCMNWKFEINHLLAKPCYKMNGSYQPASQKGGRTDTVLKVPCEDIFAVIDAKYYGADNISNLPGWPDLIKQFFYALALKDIYSSATIYNYFIFPGTLHIVESVHLQDPYTEELLDENYMPIECIYIEPLTLINNYISNKKLNVLSKKLLKM